MSRTLLVPEAGRAVETIMMGRRTRCHGGMQRRRRCVRVQGTAGRRRDEGRGGGGGTGQRSAEVKMEGDGKIWRWMWSTRQGVCAVPGLRRGSGLREEGEEDACAGRRDARTCNTGRRRSLGVRVKERRRKRGRRLACLTSTRGLQRGGGMNRSWEHRGRVKEEGEEGEGGEEMGCGRVDEDAEEKERSGAVCGASGIWGGGGVGIDKDEAWVSVALWVMRKVCAVEGAFVSSRGGGEGGGVVFREEAEELGSIEAERVMTLFGFIGRYDFAAWTLRASARLAARAILTDCLVRYTK
ncbi:hypothetical protein R3P38DRAFT_2797542 [Favolaschia claudopus]|uniref:Uncharacterized protein n=1 Tax=Favolaschia claudopus TaxID=2862362 RepID=A0AAW0A294_9AGAR